MGKAADVASETESSKERVDAEGAEPLELAVVRKEGDEGLCGRVKRQQDEGSESVDN